jgi:hypothetical protein
MTFWDGFLPALGVFAAAGVAYVTWHFWKWVLGAVTMLAVAALTSMWATDRADAYYAALFRNELVASGSVATTCDGLLDWPNGQACRNAKNLAWLSLPDDEKQIALDPWLLQSMLRRAN